MTFDEALAIAPTVIGELATEFVHRGDESLKADKTSQATACFLLALRSISLLVGMSKLMEPATRDSWDVLARSFQESTDLLMHFRFDDESTRKKIAYWFAGKADNAWKADHHKCEEFMRKLGQGESELATRWSAMATLSHPTVFAAQNSAKNVAAWLTRLAKAEDYADSIRPKLADYLTSVSKLIVVATFDLPGWIPLAFDLTRIPTADRFQRESKAAVSPILDLNATITLPKESYRFGSENSPKASKLKRISSGGGKDR